VVPPTALLLVSEVFPPAIGGSGVLLENVYSRLAGTTAIILTDGDLGRPADIRGGLRIHHVDMRAPDWGIVRPACLRRHARLTSAIRRLSGDTAIVHCGKALPEGLSAWIAQRTGGPPYVCWTHGEELGFASTSRELTWLTRLVLRGARAVVANSRHTRTLLTSGWGVPDANVHVVYPGVDSERFRPDGDDGGLRSRFASGDEFVLLSIGRLQRRKGHDTIIAALPAVRERIPNVQYLIVGNGPERESLRALADAKRVADRVHFVGAVPEPDLPKWYRAADLFVLPNRIDGADFEGFGIVFLEAAASGLAVIAGRSGGAPEAIEEGVTGCLVGGRDPLELATAIVGLASSPARRAQMGRAGRERVEREFTWDAAVRRLHAVCAAVEGAPPVDPEEPARTGSDAQSPRVPESVQ
jgi:phosphatidylinositol alpha-1,6-mannosyltransferase